MEEKDEHTFWDFITLLNFFMHGGFISKQFSLIRNRIPLSDLRHMQPPNGKECCFRLNKQVMYSVWNEQNSSPVLSQHSCEWQHIASDQHAPSQRCKWSFIAPESQQWQIQPFRYKVFSNTLVLVCQFPENRYASPLFRKVWGLNLLFENSKIQGSCVFLLVTS